MIRTTLMATHTDEHIGKVLDAFETCGKKLGLLREPASTTAV